MVWQIISRKARGKKQFLIKGLLGLMYGSIGWLIIAPIFFLLRLFVPRKKRQWVVCIGRDDGLFLDNVKYFYLFALQVPNNKVVFLTEDRKTYDALINKGWPVIFFPSWTALNYLLKTRTLVVDNWMWVKGFKRFLVVGVKRVQLWHGLAIKRIGYLNDHAVGHWWKRWFLFLIGITFEYDVFLSPSEWFVKRVYEYAFRVKRYVVSYYPRVWAMLRERVDGEEVLLNGTILEKVDAFKRHKKGKIIMFLPTYREGIRTKSPLDWERLDNFLLRHDLLLLLKLHPSETCLKVEKTDFNAIVLCPQDMDIYPLLRQVDVLITDYSSVYFDFLFLNRPVVFYQYDLKDYTKDSRDFIQEVMQFWIGPIATDQDELERELLKIIQREDVYRKERERVFDLVLDPRNYTPLHEFIKSEVT